MLYGYMRVSTKEQNLDRQMKSLVDFGVPVENIKSDKESGKDFNRDNYQLLRNEILREGDTLVIKELDRLGRNKDMLKKELDYFKSKGVRVKILNIPTTLMDIDKGQEWIIDMINNIIIEVLGAVAEEERNKIKFRQAEGIAAARRRGVVFGRPKITLPESFIESEKLYKSGKLTVTEAARLCGMCRSTFWAKVSR